MVAAIGVTLGVLIALMVHSTHPARNREPAVLGDFSGVSLAHGRVVSRFFRLGSKFIVRTDGPDDALHDYEIKYTFGVLPLQQYLIDFPGGRLQALDIAWDSRPRAQGGQRWFHLYPDKKMVARDTCARTMIRRRERSIRHMPRSTLPAKRATAREQNMWRGQSLSEIGNKRTETRACSLLSTIAETLRGPSIQRPATRDEARRAVQSAKSRCARDAIHGESCSTKIMFMASR